MVVGHVSKWGIDPLSNHGIWDYPWNLWKISVIFSDSVSDVNGYVYDTHIYIWIYRQMYVYIFNSIQSYVCHFYISISDGGCGMTITGSWLGTKTWERGVGQGGGRRPSTKTCGNRRILSGWWFGLVWDNDG